MNKKNKKKKDFSKEEQILVLQNMKRLGSRYEREIIDKIIDTLEED